MPVPLSEVHGKPPFAFRMHWDYEPSPHPPFGHPLPLGGGEGGVRGAWRASTVFVRALGPLTRLAPLSLPSPRKAGRGWPKAGRGAVHGASTISESRIGTMKPATDRSADSLVRECLGLDSCGHGCPRSDSRFMGRGHLQNSDVNRGHEPIPIVLFHFQ